ncbi:SDR family NAD(P)-dependent oxidoreductase [Microlunatus speluncae]|uniref:SDR family NAD(P)-dependent oxidoreductase n=1 Tax=Microlunatus speluncae TaxID=2594267 RepID=UPI0012664289|nr:SDR family NAD(P)-dependent oxidoreductase [Microlunatus speluncae]
MATALITGGTSGIGAAFARALAARGNDLVLVARNRERLEQTAAELADRYAVSVEVLPADLSVRADVLRVVERLTDPDQPIDLLINNAGFGIHTKLTAADLSAHEHAMTVMCGAVLLLGGAAGRVMAERGHGQIINVSSTAGFVLLGNYSAIKAWVTAYSESLAVELAGTGVTVTALLPGWVRTEFHERADLKTSKIPGPLWLDADRVVEECLVDVARGRAVSLPSKRYKLLIFFARHLPRRAIAVISARISSGRR